LPTEQLVYLLGHKHFGHMHNTFLEHVDWWCYGYFRITVVPTFIGDVSGIE